MNKLMVIEDVRGEFVGSIVFDKYKVSVEADVIDFFIEIEGKDIYTGCISFSKYNIIHGDDESGQYIAQEIGEE